MSDDSLVANPGAGGAFFKVDKVSGTSTPYMKIATTDVVQVIGNLAVTNTVAITGTITDTSQVFGKISSFAVNPIPGTSQVFGQVSSFPVSTTFVTISSSQVALGGGTQYLDSSATTAPTGMIAMYKFGAAASTMVAVASATPLPVFAISTNPLAIVGTSQVNIVSSVALGFTPTGTSMVNVVSSNTLGPLNLISSMIFADNAAYVPGTSRLGVVGGYYSSTNPALAHNDAGALLLNASSMIVNAPGAAETLVSTTPAVRVSVLDANGNQVTGFGSGTQYVDGTATTAATGMVQMYAFGAANSTVVAVSSSKPLPVYQISTGPVGPLVGTTMVNVVSSIPLGGGTQYAEAAVTTVATGNVSMWMFGAAESTVAAVSSSQPLPVFAISTVPHALVGTSQVFGGISSFAVNAIPSTSQVFGQVSSFAVNTVSTQVISSIPFIVSQSTAAWQAQVTNTVNVNIASSVTQSTSPIPIASGGLDTQLYVSVTTAPKTIKNSSGRLYDIWFTNSGTSMAWLKLFNASSASVSTGTTAPLMTFGLPAASSGVSGWLGSGYGYNFSTAIAVSVTASSATSTDTSSPPTNQILLQFGYK